MIDIAKLCLDKRKPDSLLLKSMALLHASSASQFTNNQGCNGFKEEPSSMQPWLKSSGNFIFPGPPNHVQYQRPNSSSPYNATSDSDTQSTQSDSDCRCMRSSPRKILYPKVLQHENLSDPCNRSFGNVPHLLPPIGVFWDIENCNVPKGRSALQVVQVIRNTFLDGYREEEFIVVCDVTKESSQIVRELSDAQVNLIHVPSQCKNAADEKLRQSIRRFADRHGSPSAVVLITGDINFSAEVCDLRNRRKIRVTLLHHSSSTSEALRLSANEAYDIGTLMDNLPTRGLKEPAHEPVEVTVHNLPEDKDSTRIKARLRKLSYNCGGRVISVGGGTAAVQFTSVEIAVRAQKRMEGEDVYGHKITVGPPTKVSGAGNNNTTCSTPPKGRVTYSRSQEGHQYLVSSPGYPPQVMASVYRATTSARSVYTQYNSNPNLTSCPPPNLLGIYPSSAWTGGSAFGRLAQAEVSATQSANTNGWHSTVVETVSAGRPICKTSVLNSTIYRESNPLKTNTTDSRQIVDKEPANQAFSAFSPNKKVQSSNMSAQITGNTFLHGPSVAQKSPHESIAAMFSANKNSKPVVVSSNQRPGSGPTASKMIPRPIAANRPHSNTPPSTPRPMFYCRPSVGSQSGAQIPDVSGQPPSTKNTSPFIFTGNTNKSSVTQRVQRQKTQPLAPVPSGEEPQERFFHPISSSTSVARSDVIELQVTNLDQNIDSREMKRLVTAAFAEHVTVLHVSMHTQSDGNLAAYVKLPSLEEAQFAVSQLHRRKIGYKRVMIAYVGTGGPSPQLIRSQIVSLLVEIPTHSLPLFKFCELFESRYLTSISVSEMYKMKDVCLITDGPTGRMVSLNPDHRHTPSPAFINATNESSMELPYCTIHRPGPDKGWAEQEMRPLPSVRIGLKVLTYRINVLVESHGGSLPLPSLPHCYEALFHVLEVDETGVPLEHLVSCLSGIEIYQGVGCVKYLRWGRQPADKDATGQDPVKCVSPQLVNQQALFSRELVDLLRTSPHCQLVFNRFIPAYHHHFGRQCRVADYGFTKLIDLLESLSHVVQVLGEGNKRVITLSHRAQIRRFTSDLLRVLKSQASKQVLMSQFPVVYQRALGRTWDVTDYGVCEVGDLLCEVSECSVLVTVENDDVVVSIPKREQTSEELQRSKIFSDEVVELLRHAPQCSMLFNKFIPAYHHHFGHQCRVSDYGFTKLIELFESIPHVVKVSDGPEGERSVGLTLPESLKVLADQMSALVIASDGHLPLGEVSARFMRQFGFAFRPETIGCSDVVQALQMLRTVKIVETPRGAVVKLADMAAGTLNNLWATPNHNTSLSSEVAAENLLEKYGDYLKDFITQGSSKLMYETGPPKPDTPPKVVPVVWNTHRTWQNGSPPLYSSFQSRSPPLYNPFQPFNIQTYTGLPINLPPSQPHPSSPGSPNLTSPTKSLLDAHRHPSSGVERHLPHIVAPDPSQLPRPHSFMLSATSQLGPRGNFDLGGSTLTSNGDSASSSSNGDEVSSSCASGVAGSDLADHTATVDSVDMDSSGRSTPSVGKRKTRLAAQFSTPIHT